MQIVGEAMTMSPPANIDITAALAEAEEVYRARNPKSFARHREACAVMPGGNTRSAIHVDPFPLTIVRGEGARLWDLDGHEYVDFLSEFTAGIYGHSHPAIRSAIEAALDGGLNFGAHNALEARFAAAICARFPSIELVRFTNSGTEANLMAVSAARAITGRPKILVFAGETGALLIFDEVMTSRLAPGGLQEAHGILPDLTTLGKYVGGGMSFGAFGGRADLMERFDPRRPDAFQHAGTFNNNVLTMNAGLVGLTELYTPERAGALNNWGDRLREQLNAITRRSELGMQFTGLGSMLS